MGKGLGGSKNCKNWLSRTCRSDTNFFWKSVSNWRLQCTDQQRGG